MSEQGFTKDFIDYEIEKVITEYIKIEKTDILRNRIDTMKQLDIL